MHYLGNLCFNFKKGRAHSGGIVMIRDGNRETSFEVILTDLWAHMRPWDWALVKQGKKDIVLRFLKEATLYLQKLSVIFRWYIYREWISKHYFTANPRKTRSKCHENVFMGLNTIAKLHSKPEFQILSQTSLWSKLMTKSKMAGLECLCSCESLWFLRG